MSASSLTALLRTRKATAALIMGVVLASLIAGFATVAQAQTTDCSAYSQPSCADVPVSLPYSLGWSADEGKLADKTGDANGDGTGFTMVQPSSNGGRYLPENLDVDTAGTGTLKITTTKGIQFRTAPATNNPSNYNTLDNGLGVGFDTANKATRIETTIVNPPNASNNSEQAGLWFGPNEDNYIKLAIVSTATSNSTYKFQLMKEIGGGANNNPNTAPEQIDSTPATGVSLASKTVKLTLIADPTASKVDAYYSISGVNGGADQLLGSYSVPASFFDGTTLNPKPAGVNSFAGVYATHRNRPTTATPPSLVYTFDNFRVADAVPPATPSGLTATAGTAQVELDWADNSEGDFSGYNVYRGQNKPVPTNGTPLNGSTPLTNSAFADTTAQLGTNYYYVVKAIDNVGNASAASGPARAMLDDATPKSIALPFKVNFQDQADASTPSGYIKDYGQNYANTRGFGWVEQNNPSVPLNLVGNGRNRSETGLDLRLRTLMHMQGNNVVNFANIAEAGAWEVALPNGSYDVEVSVGDASPGTDTTSHEINVEGVKAIDNFAVTSTTSGAARFKSATVEDVPLSDGKLTIDAIGGTNTKINYVDISAAPPPDTTPPAKPTVDLSSASDFGSSSTDNLTNDDTPTFIGEAEAGSTVEVFAAGTSLGTVVASGSGSYEFTVPGAIDDGTVAITVDATDAAGNPSEPSNPLNVTVDTGSPTVNITSGPSGTIDQSSATFVFTAEDGSSVACELDGIIDQSCVSPKAYTGLDDGSYTFTATATDAAGNEGSATSDFTVNTPGPGVPQITSPADDSYDTDGDLTISGTAEADSAIELFEGTQSRGTANADASGAWSISLDDVAEGAHSYTAKATKNGKTSGASAAVTVNVDTTEPGIPASLTAEGRRGSISLDWADSPAAEDVVGYNVYRSDSEGGTYAKLNTSLLTASTFDDAPLPDETTRYYQVTAVDRAGNESERASKSATTLPPPDTTPPGAPTGLSTTPGNGQVVLDWADNPAADGVAGYNVYRGTTSNVNTSGTPLNGATPLTESTFTNAGLTNGTIYYYAVKAVDGAGNPSPASSAARAMPDVATPASFTLPVQINFQNNAAAVPSGYTKDFGKNYSNVQGFGWVKPNSDEPIDLSVGGSTPGNGRDRNLNSDQRLDTLMHMQADDVQAHEQSKTPPGNFNGTPEEGEWEISLPDGVYEVAVAVGDADAPAANSNPAPESHTINVEGEDAVSGFAPTGADGSATRHKTQTVTVDVDDGKLTVDAQGGTNTKINYVTIDEGDATAPTVDTVQPEAGAENVATSTNVTGTFSESMDASTINATNFELEKQGGAGVVAAVTYDDATKKATLDPNADLDAGATYVATITTGVKDKAGNALASARTWSFTTTQAADTTAPSPPTGLAATAGDGQVALDWADNTEGDLDGYNVYRGTSAPVGTSGTPLNGATPVSKTSSQYTDATAQNGTTYHYVVTAVDTSGNESVASNGVNATPQAQQGPACSPRSTLPCAQVKVNAPVALGFDGAGSGLAEKDNQGTGFTMVDPPSAPLTPPSNPQVPGYEPSNLDVAGGKLAITSTKGIMYLTPLPPASRASTNSQVNALGVGVDAAGKVTRMETTVAGPSFPSTANSEQGGIWFGLNEDNYVKLVVFNQGSGNAKIQLLRERGAVANDTSDPATDDQLDSHPASTGFTLSGQNVKLILEADAAANNITGYYQIGSGAETKLGTLTVPASFFEGTQIASGSGTSTEKATFAGLFDTHRNGATPITLNFENFSVTSETPPADTIAPAAPTGLAATPGDGKVDLTWNANGEGDLDGYNVYRGASATVDTSGAPLNGATLLEQPSYTDATAQNGTTYHYVVVAVDASGNKSGASSSVSATPRTSTGQQFAAKINFQDAAAAVPTGYFRDYGQAYGLRTGANQGSGLSYGWINPTTRQPLDLSVGGSTPGNGRDRGFSAQGLDQRLDTLMHIQADDVSGTFNGTAQEGAWEIAVPNGTYEVTVSVGDPNTDSVVADTPRHTINVEGQNAINNFQSAGAAGTVTRHKAATVTVAVNDGKLTIDATGGFNTKINYADIASIQTGPDTTPPSAPASVLARAGDGEVSVTWNANTETDLDGYNVYAGTSATGTPLNATLLKTTYLIDRGLTNGTQRSYVVEAVDRSGNKAEAQPVSATPQAGATDNRPRIISTDPADGATNVALSGGVAATLNLVTDGVDEGTFSPQTVKLIKVSNSAQVPASYGTSGGNDVINLIPDEELEPNTQYRFEVTDGVKDLTGTRFLPYTSTFTTGTTSVFTPPGVTTGDVGNAAFDRVAQPTAPNKTYTSVTMGPDNKLYAGTVTGEIYRFDVAADGNLSNPQLINTIRQNTNDCNTSTVSNNGCTTNRLIIGLTFEPGSTAADPKLWVTHSYYGFNNMKDWGGKLSVLSGANLGTYRDVLVNLPRSSKDHLTNSIAFKNGKIYIPVGATTAMGAYDNAWKGTERLLSAAVIEVDYQNIPGALDVKTADGGTYDPYAAGAPVKVFATGVRNAVDLVWHSNGNLYTPTNGSAGGSNAPATPSNFQNLSQCQNRSDGPYTGPAVPDFDGPTTGGDGSMQINKTQDDYLYRVVRGGYYGNPNPTRCEWVLNGGNPTAGADPGENPAYPVGTRPDRNWRGWAYDFKNNQSPNGVIEYKSNNFGGKLKGKLLVVRYSQGDDIIVLEPGANGSIAKQNVGVPGLNKVTGSEDPLDLIEDTRNGNLYVTEGVKNPPDGTGKITLLRARDTGEANPADVAVDKSRLVFNDVQNGAPSASQTVTVTNNGGSDLTLSGASLSGANANQFQISAGPTGSVTLTPGQTQQISVLFNPTSVGVKGASLDIASNDADTPVAKVNLRGLGTQGLSGTNEPSLQWILDTYEIPVNVGDPNPADNSLPTTALLGDEIAAQSLQRAYAGSDVTVEPLAVFGPQDTASGTVTRVGNYATGQAASKQPIFSVANANYQSLNPTTDSKYDFAPTGDSFGFYSIWPFFSNREVFSEDTLNTWETNAANRHKVRVYPLKDKDGSVVQDAYIVATEEHTTGYDYQDVVYIVRNVEPAGGTTPDNQEIDAPEPNELVFSGVKGSTNIPTQSVSVKNSGRAPLEISGASLSGANAAAFQIVNPGARTVAAGETATFEVRFAPNGSTVGSLSAKLTIASNDADEANVDVGLYGLSTNGEQGNNEPTLQDVVNTLGYPARVHDLSGNPLTFGTDAGLKGEEVRAPLFQKAGTGSVGIKPIARYSPDELLPFGYYKLNNGDPVTTTVATIDLDQEQTLNPKVQAGGASSFDPGSDKFGVFVDSRSFNRKSYQQDGLNTGSVAHAVRIYPAENRSGQPIANAYVVTFEDAANGDYQDYVFLVTNVKPATAGGAGLSAKINFQPAGTAPTGYTADTGQGFDATRGFGWVTPGTSTPVSKTADTRDRAVTHPADATGDRLRDTLIIMAPSSSNTSPVNGAWEYAVPNGSYTVKVSVGDPAFVDSTHRINVEGTNAINDFVPTTANEFATNTVTVQVSDGRLTVDQVGGTQTKLNYVEITGQSSSGPDTTNPTVGVELGGTQTTGGAYKNNTRVTINAADEGGSGVESTSYSLDGGPFQAYTAPFFVNAPGSHTVRARAVDGAGNFAETTRTFSVVVSRSEIELENGDGGTISSTVTAPGVPFPDRLAMSRIQNPQDGTGTVPKNYVHDVSTVRVKNTGTDPLGITDLQVTGPFQLEGAPTLPASVPAGGSLDIKVRFVATSGTVHNGTLTITSDDADEPTIPVELSGFWQSVSEGGQEPDNVEINRVFGYGTTILYPGQQLNNGGKLTAIGDEILSPYWQRASTTKPVTVRQLAAFHTQGNTASFFWHAKGSNTTTNVLTHLGVDGQSLLPRRNGTNPDTGTTPAYAEFTPSATTFGFKIDPEWSDWTKNNSQVDIDNGCTGTCGHHMRFWPVRDRAGKIIPNQYLVGMDYAGINYDFNDNVYLVTNIKPENAAANPAAPSPLPGSPSLNIGFDKDYPGTLEDKDGTATGYQANTGTGFSSTQRNENDQTDGSDSYKPELLDIDTAAGTLAVRTFGTDTAGSNGGQDNTLVNGLRTNFDGSSGKFVVGAELNGPLSFTSGNQQGGVMFGPDQDNFVKLVAINNNGSPAVEFLAEQNGTGGTLGTKIPIPNAASVTSLELFLLGDPQEGTVKAAYRINGGAVQTLPSTVTLTGAQVGRFFSEQAKGGIITQHKGGTETTVTFDNFSVTEEIPGATPEPQREALYRLDVAGTGNYTDTKGNLWKPDTGFFAPSTAPNEGATVQPQDIANTEDDVIYRTYRGNVGNVAQDLRVLTYNLPTRGLEQLDLRLHFAERASANNTAGKRVFDIEAEGKLLRDDFDIYAAAGGQNTAIVLPLNNVAVKDGNLTLALRASADYPAIAGIEVLCEGTCPAPDTQAPEAPTGLTATGSDSGIALDWANNAETDLSGYNVYRAASATGTYTKVNDTLLTASQYNDTAAPAGQASFYQVKAIDSSGNESNASNTANATRPAGGIRINTGGPAQTVNGVTWRACSSTTNCSGYVTGGNAYSESDTITGIPQGMNNTIFQSEWTGGQASGVPVGQVAFTFNVPVSNGAHTVKLHFAELNKNAPNLRLFDVNIEGGALELNDFDVYAAAGGIDKAIMREFQTNVTDGNVTIQFITVKENAKISAIEIIPAAPDTQAPAAPTGLTATVSGGIALDWANNAEGDLAGYNVYRSNSQGGTFAKLNASPLTASEYKDATASGPNDLYYQVKAVDASGNESGAATTSKTLPAPTGFTTITWGNAASQQFSNSEGQAEVVNDKLYTFGGFDSQKSCCTPTKRAYVYDPAATSWAAIADLPYTPTGSGFGGVTHAGFTTDGTNIFMAGGYTSNAAGTGQTFGTKQVYRYNVSANNYTRLPDLPVERAAGQLEHVDNKLYYYGGTNLARTQDVGNLYVLDLNNLAAGWTEKTDASLPNPRHHLASVVLGGKIYAIGGQHGHDAALVPDNDVHVYDPQANKWTQAQDMPKAINHATASTFVMDGRIIVAGGQVNHGTAVADVTAYDPQANAWTPLTPLPTPRHSAMAGTINGDIFFTTGGTAATLKGTTSLSNVAAPAITAPAQNSYDTDGDFAVSGTAEPGSTVELFEGTASRGTATTSAGGAWSIDLADVAEGSHTYTAKATVSGRTSGSSNALTVNVDTTSPAVTGKTPAANATNVAVGTNVTATFSDEMTASTLDATTFKLVEQGSATAVPAAITYDAAAKTATLNPGADLKPNATYTATVSTGAKDKAGNPLTANEAWSFATAEPADTQPPTVTNTVPAAEATDVDVAADVKATFSEKMTASTISTSTFLLTEQGGAAVGASVTYDASADTATLNPSADLKPNTNYVATVKSGVNGVKDLAGNALAADKTWSFTTKAAVNPQQPIRIEAGGPGRTVGSTQWLACNSVSNCGGYVSGGFSYKPSTTPTIVKPVAPANQNVYFQEWTGGQTNGVPAGAVAFTFDVPVQNGNYLIRLHFAEIAQNGVGKRLFDVNIEGAKKLDNFDIFKESGGMNRAIVREFPVTVSDGKATIAFIREVENAKISGIEIVPVQGGAPSPDGQAPAVPGGLAANAASGGIGLDWANNTEGDLAGYNVSRSTSATGTFTKLNNALLTSSQFTDTTAQPGTTYHYRVVAFDQAGNQSAPATTSAAIPSRPTHRINIGGPAQTIGGTTWSSCQSATACQLAIVGTGKRVTYSGTATGTTFPALFNTGWTGGQSTGSAAGQRAFGFDDTLPEGKYQVRLHFAEMEKNAAGQRTFHVNLENGRVLSNFDVYQAAGGKNKAIVRQFTVNSVGANGKLDIDFITQKGDAFVQAIEVIPA